MAQLNQTIADYVTSFNSDEYRRIYTITENSDAPNEDFVKTYSQLYHEVFARHDRGARLVDVGCGPTQWHLMSACGKYAGITVCDPLPANRAHQQRFIDTEGIQVETWGPFYKYIAALEGNK